MKHYAAVLFSTALLLPLTAFAATVSPQGKAFLTYTVADSLGEISLCQMAEQKSSSAEVKSFCTTAMADH